MSKSQRSHKVLVNSDLQNAAAFYGSCKHTAITCRMYVQLCEVYCTGILVWLCMHSLSKYINSSLPQLSGMWEEANCSVILNTTTLRPLPDELFFCGGHFQHMHALNLPYHPFYPNFSPQTTHKCPYSHLLYICDPDHTHPLTSLQQSWLLGSNCSSRLGKKLHCQELGSNKARELFSQTICTQEDRNGPPSANQWVFKAEPRDGHAVCSLRVHPPTYPCPALSARLNLSAKDIDRSDIMQRKVSCR